MLTVPTCLRGDLPSPLPGWMRVGLYGVALGLPTIVLLALVVQPWWNMADLLRDPLSVAEMAVKAGARCCRRHFGAISILGGLMMAAAAGFFVFTAAMRRMTLGRIDGGVVFLALGFVLSTSIGLDDMYRFHEGKYEKLFDASYAGLLGLIFVTGWFRLARFERQLLLLTAAFFAASVGIDILQNTQFVIDLLGPYRIVFEDGAKLFGISSWTAFAAAAGIALTRPGPSQAS